MPRRGVNAAIGHDQRAIIAKWFRYVLGDLTLGLEILPSGERELLMSLADRLERPGPPLVSAADVWELLELIHKLSEMRPGEVLDHQWGYIRRVDDGFRVAAPDQAEAEGSWASDNVLARAQRMYEDHLYQRGLTPHP